MCKIITPNILKEQLKVYNYSPIKEMRIQNFRNIGDITIDFSSSPIIALLGENEAGKTSVVKAFATCALHANPREQKDYIRENTNQFVVQIQLENGLSVARQKQNPGLNRYVIADKDKNVIFSTDKLAEGLPIEIQNLMGLIIEPETNEPLQVRTYEDRLLFVTTPSSCNYKVMYNALKVEQLTKAVSIGNKEINSLKSVIKDNSTRLDGFQSQASAIKVYDIEPVVNVKNRLVSQMALLNKIEQAKGLIDKVKYCERKLGALLLIDKFKLDTINELAVSRLSNVERLLNKVKNSEKELLPLKEIENLEEINTSTEGKLRSIIEKKENLSNKMASASALVSIRDLDDISETTIMQLSKVRSLTSSLTEKQNKLKIIDTSSIDLIDENKLTQTLNKFVKIESGNQKIEQCRSQITPLENAINQIVEWMKYYHVATETCPKCGETVVIDIDKIEGFGG
jgi:hypothetical protein